MHDPAHAGARPGRLPWWTGLARPGLRASAEALFPPNDLGAPDWQAARVVDRLLALAAALPPPQRRLVLLLFVAVPWMPIVLLQTLVPFRFCSPERRAELVRAWRTSRWFLVRMIGDSVKATLTMAYMQDPEVLRFMGAHTVCAGSDDFPLEVRPGALREAS